MYFCFRWSWLLHWGIADPSSCSQLNNSSQAEVVKIVNSSLSDKPSKFSITVVQKSPGHMILFNPLYPPNPNQDHIEWSLIVNTLAPCSLNNVGGLKEKACQAVLPTPTAEDLGLHLLFHQQALSTTLPGCYLCSVCYPGVSCSERCPPDQLWGYRGPHSHVSDPRAMYVVTGMPQAEPTALQRCTWLHEKVLVLLFSFLLLFLTHLKFFWFFFFFGELLSWFGSFGLRLKQYFCSRSRLSWGQITGCYNCFRLPVCVVRTGDGPSVLLGPSCHLYPVAILLVTSHLLVLWLILSLVLLVDQWHSDVQKCFIFSLNTSLV